MNSVSGGGASIAEVHLATSNGGTTVTGSGTAAASTVFSSPTFDASKAFDGNLSTLWSAASADTNAWLSYDFGLGNAFDIVECVIIARNDGFSQFSPRSFSLQYSDDNTTWTNAAPTQFYIMFTCGAWTNGSTQTFDLSALPALVAQQPFWNRRLQQNIAAFQDEFVDDDLTAKPLTIRRKLVPTTYIRNTLSVGKFLEYDVLIPPDADVGVSKALQYDVLIPPDADVNIAKALNYAVVEAMPSIKPPPYTFWMRNREGWQDDTDAEDQRNSQKLLTARRFPTLTRLDNNTNLTGTAVIGAVGSVSIKIDKALTGVAGTSAVGSAAILLNKTLTGVAGTSHVGTEKAQISALPTGVGATTGTGIVSPKVDADQSVTGVGASGQIGDLVPEGSHALSGVQIDSAIGDLAIEVDANLVGVPSSALLGSPSVLTSLDVNATGVHGTAAVGLPLVAGSGVHISGVVGSASPGVLRSFIEKHIGFPPTLTEDWRGVTANTAVGHFGFSSDRVINGTHATAQAGRLKVLGSLDGVVGNTAVGRLAWAPTFTIRGQQGTTGIGEPLAHAGPNETIIGPLTGVQASARIGRLVPGRTVAVLGVHGTASVGSLGALIAQAGFRVSFLDSATVPVKNTQAEVSIRWSDTRGSSWNTPIIRSLGDTGEYQTNIQILNMGIARDRIYEISWSAPDATALTGVFLRTEDSST